MVRVGAGAKPQATVSTSIKEAITVKLATLGAELAELSSVARSTVYCAIEAHEQLLDNEPRQPATSSATRSRHPRDHS